MAFDKDAFLTALDSMTVMELNDLVKAIEEKFGVSAAAMAAGAAMAAALTPNFSSTAFTRSWSSMTVMLSSAVSNASLSNDMINS